jgi:IclR family transcriptional regulator, KDG regulon repressor
MKVQSLDRAFDILELLSREQHGLPLTQIATRVDLHKATVHRLLNAMRERGYIERAPDGGYRLGMGFVDLASLHLNHLELKTEAQPVLHDLVSRTGNTAFLATEQDGEVVYLDKQETFESLRKYSIIGRRAPMYCTSLGKALLSGMDEERVRAVASGRPLAAFTGNTITTVDRLLADIERTRGRGWSVDDEEYELGIRCVGAPVRDYRGTVIAALSTSGTTAMIPPERVEEIGAAMVRAAAELSRRMGFR